MDHRHQRKRATVCCFTAKAVVVVRCLTVGTAQQHLTQGGDLAF